MSKMSTATLRKKREAAGLSSRELSRRLGKNELYISSVENKDGNVPEHMVDAIIAALKGEVVPPTTWEHASDTFDAARLSSLITERNINCSQLARDCGVTRATLYNAMQGKSQPGEEFARSLAAALSLPVDWFYGYGDSGASDAAPIASNGKAGMVLLKVNKKAFDIIKEVLDGVEGVEWRCL